MADRTRSINDLRVIDLRVELEKRSLDKSGVRNVLIERLTKHLVEEGHDPATFKFELSGSEPKTPAKRPRRSESTVEQAEDETPAMEDMIVQDHVGDEEEAEPKADNSIESTEKIPEEKMEVDNAEKSNRKRENKDEPEATVAKKPCLDSNDSKTEEDNKALENNADAEDSINLDINEDELLNDEAEGTTKINKIDVASFAKTGAAMEDDDNTGGGADTAADSASTDAQQEVDAEVPATSNGSEEDKDNDQKDDKDENGDKKKDDGKEGGARNLWVSGLSGDTRAKDLKQLCSKHGKVIGAKVVTNARTPGSRCYGYVTMGSAQDAENCIKNLHRTELHGRMISVEKAKSESESTTRRSVPARPERRSSSDRKDDKDKTNEDGKENAEKVVDGKTEPSGADSTRSTSRSREKSHRSEKDYDTTDEKIWKNSGVVRRNNHQARENCSFCHDMNHTLYKCRAFGDMTSADRKTWAYTNGKCFRCLRDHFTRDCESKSWCKFCKSTNHNSMICSQEPHGQRPQDRPRRSTRSRERRRSPREVLSFSKIWKERDLARERERSRAAREEVRRRRAAEDALRERERRQRQEKHRLAIEKEKLRAEREKIEREKNELLRLERERHRLEREKLELERMELKRAQLRLEEERRKRSGYEGGAYRKAPSPPPAPAYERDPRDPRDPRHKRPPPPPMSSHRQFEAPPPPRFEMPAPAYERDKRDRERDYKRDYPRHVSSSNVKYPTNGSSNDDSRQPLPPGTRPKEPSRAYDARDSRAYRPSPPGKPEPRAWPPSRYVDSAAPPKGGSTSEGWGGSGGGASGGGGGGSAGEARYGSGYEARYTPAYQPPPPGASYPDRYQAPREYRKY